MNPDLSRSSDKAQAVLVELTRLLLGGSPVEDGEPRPEIELHHMEIETGHERRAELLTERFVASDYQGALALFAPERRALAAMLLMDALTDDELADLVTDNSPATKP